MTNDDTVRHSVITEERMRADIARLLGEPADSIDPHENLLDRGLDSIRLMSLLETWRKTASPPTSPTSRKNPPSRPGWCSSPSSPNPAPCLRSSN